jgi:hypothetical protein
MLISELIARLHLADPDATVLYLPLYRDASESGVVNDVFLPASMWIRGHDNSQGSEFYLYRPRDPGSEEHAEGITFSDIKVVVLDEDLENLHNYGL